MAFQMKKIVLFYFVISSFVAMVMSVGCLYNGRMLRVGQTYQPRPCDICTCSADGPHCATNNCFYYVMCADGHKDPNQCCMVCPNGDNCKASDGTIVRRGDTYHMSNGQTCSCEEPFGLYGGSAVCK